MKFDTTHVFSSKKRGLMSLKAQSLKKHHRIVLLKEVCKDVRVEPFLPQLTGETLQHHTTRGNEVRLDMCPRGFWEAGWLSSIFWCQGF